MPGSLPKSEEELACPPTTKLLPPLQASCVVRKSFSIVLIHQVAICFCHPGTAAKVKQWVDIRKGTGNFHRLLRGKLHSGKARHSALGPGDRGLDQ